MPVIDEAAVDIDVVAGELRRTTDDRLTAHQRLLGGGLLGRREALDAEERALSRQVALEPRIHGRGVPVEVGSGLWGEQRRSGDGRGGNQREAESEDFGTHRMGSSVYNARTFWA